MKKFFFLLVAAIVVATATYAQSSMLATLSHEGQISTFYGPLALRDAYASAENGDIITLSSGSFNSVDITKGVTIRGAGMGIDKLASTEPTVITGDFKINIPDEVSERLTLEGIYNNHAIEVCGNFKNGTFLKDRFKDIRYNGSARINNLTMIHCKVANKISIPSESSVSCVNCVINGTAVGSGNSSNYEFLNCIVRNDYFNSDDIGVSTFKNSILIIHNGGNRLYDSAVAYNCIGIGSGYLFYNISNTTNMIKEFKDVFKTYTGTYNDDETFELTDDAKANFLGIDGTQVGIYGGNMPFSTTPTNPQITKCNVAAKSTADGKLSVDITVNGAE